MMRRLVIVQSGPTQFDAPLFARMAADPDWALQVIYTRVGGTAPVDDEIGHAPLWDHLADHRYPQWELSAAELKRPSRVASSIARKRPGLVILGGYSPTIFTRLAWSLRRTGIPIGLRSDNSLEHSTFRGSKGVLKRAVLPLWLRAYDTWHPVGSLARAYLETVSRARRPTFKFPYSVDNRWLAERAAAFRRQGDALRETLGLRSGQFVVLGVMKWHPREDPLTLLDAFSLLRQGVAGVKLILLGDGPLAPEVRARAASLGPDVLLPGYVPYSRLPMYYALSDVFVHPAINEPWGVSVNEAMACGVPVVAADSVGAGVDLIEPGQTGLVFPARDSHALMRQLLWLLEHRADCASIGDAARRAVSAWDYDQSIRGLAAAVDYAVSIRPRVEAR